MNDDIRETIDVGGVPIAVRRQEGRAPGIMWLGGFRSDMTGTKAETLAGFARRQGPRLPAARLFRAMASRAARSATARSRAGSPRASRCSSASQRRARSWSARRWAPGSRCAWSRSCARRAKASRIAGLVLIAPAPDFVTELMEPKLTSQAEARRSPTKGYFEEPSAYSAEPNVYTRALFEDGQAEPRDDRADRHALPGAHPAGNGRSGRAAQPCAEACQPSAGRRPDGVAHPGRRPPAVAAAGSRHAASARSRR